MSSKNGVRLKRRAEGLRERLRGETHGIGIGIPGDEVLHANKEPCIRMTASTIFDRVTTLWKSLTSLGESPDLRDG